MIDRVAYILITILCCFLRSSTADFIHYVQRGDYLIVGVHGDAVVNRHRGMNLPLMNLHERVLSVRGCRYVDDVVIDAPYVITHDMIASLNISEVLHGNQSDCIGNGEQLAKEERSKFYLVGTNE